jgi:hypothetical protein
LTPVAGPAAPTARIPLTGADCFLRAFDAEVARFNGASHLSQLVLRLGPGFDVDALRELVHEAAAAQPILRAPVRRRYGLGAPHYCLAAAARRPQPPVDVHDAAAPSADGAFPALFARRMNEPRSLRRGDLLRFDAVRYAGGAAGTDLAMTWQHLLFDGSGSERFVRWLDECFRGEQRVDALPNPGEFDAPDAAQRSLGQRGAAARAWQAWLEGFASHPPHSLAGPRRRTPQRLEWDLLTLGASDTERVVAEAGRRAGFLTPMLYYLAVAIRAHHAVVRARGLDPGSYVVPLPVNVRPRGAEGAIFRTHVSLIWFRALPEEVEDLDRLISTLKEQRLAAIKAGHVENGIDAMGFARFAPTRLYTAMARRSFAGELCSFFFAFTGEFLGGLERFLGTEIRNGFHVAPVPPSPGSCAAMSLRRGRLNVTHVRQRGVFAEAEQALFRASLRADLGCGA